MTADKNNLNSIELTPEQIQLKIAIHTTKANAHGNTILAFFAVIPLAAIFLLERVAKNVDAGTMCAMPLYDVVVIAGMFVLIVVLLLAIYSCNKLADKEMAELEKLLPGYGKKEGLLKRALNKLKAVIYCIF